MLFAELRQTPLPNEKGTDVSKNFNPDDIWRWSAVDLAQGIRSGAISSEEAVRSVHARIDAVNSTLNAIVFEDRERALSAARAADGARAKGAPLGILHGVPVTIKLNVDVAGEATTNGVPAFRDRIAPADSSVVNNLRAAGAVIVGRTNTPAFSFRWFTDNLVHGRTINPWSAGVTPGGSSGGAGVAVAAGMCAIAHGTDIAGSIRYPAYVNGVVGLRTTPGRVPAYHPTTAIRPYGVQSMSSQGPLTRSVADAELALRAMAAGDPLDTTWIDARLDYDDDAAPVRVALVDEIDGVAVVPEVVDALKKAARALEERGYVVERARLPDVQEAVAVWLSIVMTEVRLQMMQAVDASGDEALQRFVHHFADCSAPTDLDGYVKAIARRDELRRTWNLFLHRYPLILMPTSCQLAQPWGADQGNLDEIRQLVAVQSPLMSVAALGLPGIHVPTGFAGGLPVGVQLVSNAFREMRMLAAARIIEEAVSM
jgi:amidase